MNLAPDVPAIAQVITAAIVLGTIALLLARLLSFRSKRDTKQISIIQAVTPPPGCVHVSERLSPEQLAAARQLAQHVLSQQND